MGLTSCFCLTLCTVMLSKTTTYFDSDTIAAIATPFGTSGIGIIRISGPESLRIAATLFRSPTFSPQNVRSHHLYHGLIVDPHDSLPLDDVLLSYMRAPSSYTGEDVVEINMHGGILVLQKTLEIVCTLGARIARPGEFTRRAFCNGRIDLAQAEAVMDVIAAQTETGLKIASHLLTGEFSRKVNKFIDELVDIAAHLEASIDFPEEDIQPQESEELKRRLREVVASIRRLHSTYVQGTMIRTGVQAVITGKPNVGKSSILNALLGKYRAIVTPYPGTTRDIIQETINVQGIPVHLFDTAGLWESEHEIERIGIDLAREQIVQADIILLVLDGSTALDQSDRSIISMVQGKRSIVLINKSDLPQILCDDEVMAALPDARMIRVSALTLQGIDRVKNEISRTLLDGGTINTSEIIVANLRHAQALEHAAEALEHAWEGLQNGLPPELIAVDIQAGIASLGEITGRTAGEDILDRIFDTFCIGK